MTNDQNIDQLFRDKLFNREFEFNPAHWESAEKMIEAQEKEKNYWFGGKKAVIISAVLLLITGGYFLFNDSSENNLQENNLPESEITEESSAVKNGEEEKTNIQNEEIKSEEKSNSNVAGNTDAEQKSIAKDKSVSRENKSAKNKVATADSEKIQENVKSETEPSKVENTISDTSNEQETSVEYEPEIFKLDKAVITNNEDKRLPVKPLKSKKAKSKKGPNSEDCIEEDLLNENQNPMDEQEENSELLASTEGIILLPEKQEIQEEIINVQQSEITIQNPLTNEQEASAEAEIIQPLKDRLNWLRHISLGIMAGESVSSDLKNTSSTLGSISVRPIGGLRMAYQLNEQVDIESGVFYNYRSGLNSRITTLVSKDAGANIDHFKTEKTLSLHYLDLPLYLTYKHGQHSFIVGVQYSHLINTYQQTTNEKEENGYSSVENSTKKWVKNDGRFANYDVAAMIGYEYEISDRIRLSVRYNRGFFDVTDNSSFGNSVRDINKQFRIMLDYRFMKY